MINCLLDNGADVNKLNDDGVSALVISFFNLYPVSVFTETSRTGALSSQPEQPTKCAVCWLNLFVCVSLYRFQPVCLYLICDYQCGWKCPNSDVLLHNVTPSFIFFLAGICLSINRLFFWVNYTCMKLVQRQTLSLNFVTHRYLCLYYRCENEWVPVSQTMSTTKSEGALPVATDFTIANAKA